MRSSTRRSAERINFRPRAARALLLGAMLSAGVLVVAEFLTLYSVRVVRGSASIPPVAAGTENHYALIPIAVLAVVLVVAAIRSGERWALGAVALLGLLALLIGLIHDLPDARRTGLVGSLHTGWVRGASSPSVGMYLETLGAVLLLLTAGLGLLFAEQVEAPAPEESKPAPRPFGVGLENAVGEKPAPLAPTPATAFAGPAPNGADAERPVVTPSSAKRRQPTTGGRSPSAKRTQTVSATGAKSPPAKRSRATPAKGATAAGAPKKPATKRSPASSTAKRSPSASSGRTPSSSPKAAKRSPSTPAKRSPSTPAKRAPSTRAKRAPSKRDKPT